MKDRLTGNPQDWTQTADELPPMGLVVETKIDDGEGVRNVQTLMRDGGLWWFPDRSMYVYYRPTHWRLTADTKAAGL